MTAKRFFKKTGKILLCVLGFALVVIIALVIFINTNYGKKLVRDKVQSYLAGKLKTKVIIGSVDYSLPKWIEIRGVYLEDQLKDTLLYGERLAVDLDMIKLVRGITYINKIELKNIYANISRPGNDTVFNFQFVVDAFSGNKPDTEVDKDTATMKLTLKKLLLNDIRVRFTDNYSGTDFNAAIGHLETEVNKFQPDRLQFDVNNFSAQGLNFFMSTYKNIDSPVDTTETKNELQLVAKQLDLIDVTVAIEDKTNGMYYGNKVAHLALNNADLDLAKQQITASNILLDSSFIQFNSPKSSPKEITDTASGNSSWNIAVGELQLNNDHFRFDDNNVAPAKEGVDPAHLDLEQIYIKAGKLFYSSDSILAGIKQLAFKDKSGFIIDTTHADIVYSNKELSATKLYLKTGQSLIQNTLVLKYDDIKQLTKNPQNSSVAVKLVNSTIAINDLYMLMPSVKGALPPEKFRNNVVRLNTTINGTLQQMNVPLLQLNGLSGTVINAKAILYNITDSNRLAYDITIFNSSIPKADIVKFIPENDTETAGKLPAVIKLNTHIKGDMKNTEAYLDVNSSAFRFLGKANLRNINDPRKLKYDIAVKNSRIEKGFIKSVLPKGTLPESIELPEVITITGTAKGDMNNVATDLKLDGSDGRIAVKGFVHNFKNQETATYDLQFATDNFTLGKFLKKDTLIGNITLSGNAKGTGFNYKTMHSTINADIQSAGFNKYNYQDISLNTILDGGVITGNGTIKDSALQLQYDATADVRGEHPALEATILVDTVQLKRLNLYEDTLNASFKAYIKATDLQVDELNAYVRIDSSKLNMNSKFYSLDTIVVNAMTKDGIHDVTIYSPFIDAKANGDFDFENIAPSVLNYIDRYYDVADDSLANIPAQQVSFSGEIKKHSLVTDIVTGLGYQNIVFKGSYTSKNNDSALNFLADIPYLSYQKNKISAGKVDMVSLNDKINASIKFDTLDYSGNLFYATDISLTAATDSISISAVTKDIKNEDRYVIGANITGKKNEYIFSLKDTLLLNYNKWDVSPDNKITWSPDGILVNNFILSNKEQKIAITSRQPVLNSPIDVVIDSFDIKDITSIVSSDTLLAAGVINGKLTVSDFDKQVPSFVGDLSVSRFEVKQQPVGTLKLMTRKEDDNKINASLELTENGNDVSLAGNYYLNNSEQQFDADVNIRQLKMKTIQVFSNDNLSNSSGNVVGKVSLQGKFNQPQWNGFVGFDTAKFTITQLATAYTIDQQRVLLDYPTITFDKFIIKDSAGHILSIDGKITSRTMSDYDLGMKIHADDFTLINAPRKVNDKVFGFAAIDADVSVTGTSTSPNIDGDMSLNDKTDLTLVLPESNVNKDAAKTIVRFVDIDTFMLTDKKGFVPVSEPKTGFGEFVNYNLNLEVSKKAAFTIIIDPSTGDELKVQGDAHLNAGVDPGGNLALAGNYELNSGFYILHYEILKRQFDLLPGSIITFGGEPEDAQININAQYIVRTTARDLLVNEVADDDPRMQSAISQKIPFRVLLYLKGTLKKPDISFDIQLPETNVQVNSELRTMIENKLTQLRTDVASTNKQVFSLLLLSRFAPEQSSDYFKGNGSGMEDMARESVSQFLSSAMDQIAADLIKGVDIDLNLSSYKDYSSGNEQQRTDLNVAITKKFMDDRLSVSVGKDFGIEGYDANAAMQKGNSFWPDVTINYKLSADGKYAMRAYRKSQFEVFVDGYVVQTGVAFVVTLDYNKFNELFNKKTIE